MSRRIGEIVEGYVVSMNRYGVWVLCEGERLFVPLSEIAWYEIEHPSELLEVGEWVKVKVLGVAASGETQCALYKREPKGRPDPALHVDILVHTPAGSQVAYDFDPVERRPRLLCVMRSSHHFPAEFGHVEKALSIRETSLSAFLLVSRPTIPGCVAAGRALGHLRVRDEDGRDNIFLAIAANDARYQDVHSPRDVDRHKLREIEQFVRVFADERGQRITVEGWVDPSETRALLTDARERWQKRQP